MVLDPQTARLRPEDRQLLEQIEREIDEQLADTFNRGTPSEPYAMTVSATIPLRSVRGPNFPEVVRTALVERYQRAGWRRVVIEALEMPQGRPRPQEYAALFWAP